MSSLHPSGRCLLNESGVKNAFDLYEFPLLYSLHGAPLVNFFTEKPEDLSHESGLVAMRANVMWSDIPVTGELKKLAERYETVCSGQRAFELYFLSKSRSHFSVWCRLHAHFSGKKINTLQVFLQRKPFKKKVPAKMTEISNSLGGYPNGIKAIFEKMDIKSALPCRAYADLLSLQATFKIKRQPPPKPSVSPFRVTQEKITLQKRDGTTVILDLFKGGESVEIESNLELAPNMECFEIACGLLVDKIKPILRPK